MSTLLYVIGSPRTRDSYSNRIAARFLERYQQAHPETTIDVLDLWKERIPEYDGDKAAAKMAVIAGSALNGNEQTAWDDITAVIKRFTTADHYLFSVPMWNGSIPYRLKLYIDTITQPGHLFGFDPNQGYIGLLHHKRATVVYSSGVYRDGIAPSFGLDFHQRYFDWWLKLIGIEDVARISFQSNMMLPDPNAGLEAALAEADTLAQR